LYLLVEMRDVEPVYLLDDVDGVVQLLPLQKGVQVVQEVEEVSLSAAMRDEHRHALPRRAVRRLVLAFGHAFVLTLHLLQRQRGFKGQLHRALCGSQQIKTRNIGDYTVGGDHIVQQISHLMELFLLPFQTCPRQTTCIIYKCNTRVFWVDNADKQWRKYPWIKVKQSRV